MEVGTIAIHFYLTLSVKKNARNKDDGIVRSSNCTRTRPQHESSGTPQEQLTVTFWQLTRPSSKFQLKVLINMASLTTAVRVKPWHIVVMTESAGTRKPTYVHILCTAPLLHLPPHRKNLASLGIAFSLQRSDGRVAARRGAPCNFLR